jgi:hypothetical protein
VSEDAELVLRLDRLGLGEVARGDPLREATQAIGQTRPVLVHRLVARDSVEEAMLALQARKRGLAAAALEAGAGAEGGLRREDLLGVLEEA